MPLKAKVDGEEIIASYVPMENWLKLQKEVQSKKKHVVMSCCGAAGHIKLNHRGTKFFAHNKGTLGDCPLRGETADHRLAKEIILLACRDSGFKAEPEYVGSKWRADVFAEKGDLKIAFEIQCSPQTMEKTLVRRNLHLTDGVVSCWFFTNVPKTPVYRQNQLGENPNFVYELVKSKKNGFDVISNGKTQSLSDFIQDYLAELELENSKLSEIIDLFEGVVESDEDVIPYYTAFQSSEDPKEDFVILLKSFGLLLSPLLLALLLKSFKKHKWKWLVGLLLLTTPWIYFNLKEKVFKHVPKTN